MASLLEFADRAFAYVLYAGWQAALLAAIVLVVVGTLRNRVPVRWQFALWMVVLVRLALPAVPASPWSLFNVAAELVAAWGGRELPGGVTRMSASPSAGGTLAVATEAAGSSNPHAASPALAGAVAPASHGEPLASPLRWLVLAWATGASCLLLRRECQAWRMSQWARRWRAVEDPRILSLLEECRRQAGVRRVVRLVETPDDVGPAAVGLWRPQILLPRALPGMLAADELRLVLLHELLHFRRHDILLDWLASLVTIVHWMNPVAWLALARIRRLREVACDARVLDAVGAGQQQRYGLVVLKVVEQLVAPRAVPASAGAFGSQAALTTRIRAIRNHRPTTPWASAAGWGLLLTLMATGLTDAWQAPADSLPPPPAPSNVEGRVVDEVTGQSAAGLVVSLQGVMDPPLSNGDTVAWEQTRTDSQGRYRLTSLRAGTYNIWADAADRACVAIDSLAVPAAQTVVAPDLRLVAGGWIEGHVWDAAQGRALSRHPDTGQPISIAWYGPSRPKSGPACQTMTVDEQGVFRIRVAPGKSYPYIQFSDLWQRTWPRVAFTEGIDVRPGEVETLVFAVYGYRRPEVRERSQGTLSMPVPEEREAAEAIRQLGGWYALDAEQHVVEVNMVYHEDAAIGKRYDNPQTDTDAVLEHLAAFPRLKSLFLTEGQATDRSLPLVAGRTSLEVLMIWEARDVSDVGIAHLATLVNLNDLHVNNGKLTDRSLAILSRLPRLQHLSLQENAFTDEGLKHLRDMTQLRSLWLGLGRSRFTDAGLVHLAKLTNLEELDLQGSPLTRSGREQLEKLPKLRSLHLSTP